MSRSPPTIAGLRFHVAPLVVKDKVIVGVSGGEYGIRGFIDAYDGHRGGERGDSIPFQVPVSPDTKPGREIHGRQAERPHGSRALTIPS